MPQIFEKLFWRRADRSVSPFLAMLVAFGAACGDDTTSGGGGSGGSPTGGQGPAGGGGEGGAGASQSGGGGAGGEGGAPPNTTVNCDAPEGSIPPLTITSLKPDSYYMAVPIFGATAPGDLDRIYIGDLTGPIHIFDTTTETFGPEVFVNIYDQVLYGGERGLLGLAFHPDYQENGRFFIHFSQAGTGNTEIAEFARIDEDHGNPVKVRTILTETQPAENHNGGSIEFGPDGLLYVFLGDGGGNQAVAQDPQSRLGKVLRIDVDSGDPFAPAGGYPGGLPEVWAIGLRNPWRATLDPCTELFYIADVGQFAYEEVDIAKPSDVGLNFGWNVVEGDGHCYDAQTCDQTGMTLPIHEYAHDPALGGAASISGGYVYRGSRIPSLRGRYFFADWVTGQMWSLRYEEGAVVDVIDHTAELGVQQIAGFAQDADGELYAVGAQNLFRIDVAE